MHKNKNKNLVSRIKEATFNKSFRCSISHQIPPLMRDISENNSNTENIIIYTLYESGTNDILFTFSSKEGYWRDIWIHFDNVIHNK